MVNVLNNEPQRDIPRLDLSHRVELCGVESGVRPLSIYDQLAPEAGTPWPTPVEAAAHELATIDSAREIGEVLA